MKLITSLLHEPRFWIARLALTLVLVGAGLAMVVILVSGRLGQLDRSASIVSELDDCQPSVEWMGTEPVGMYFGNPLANFNLSDDDLEHLARLQSLRAVGIEFAPHISNSGFLHLSKLPELRELSVTLSQVGSEGFASLRGLANLHSLGLQGTNVSDSDLIDLVRLPNLVELDLRCTNVTDSGLQVLAQSRTMRHVDLTIDNEDISEAGVAELRRQAPWLTVSTQLTLRSPRSPSPPSRILGSQGAMPPPGSESSPTSVILAEAEEGSVVAQIVCDLSEEQLATTGLSLNEGPPCAPALFEAIRNRLPRPVVVWFAERLVPPVSDARFADEQIALLIQDDLAVDLRVGCRGGDAIVKRLHVEKDNDRVRPRPASGQQSP